MKKVIALRAAICVMFAVSLKAKNSDYGIGATIKNQ
jgi:hypothetical protein